jgi:pimeloyl-ACP methyl ester carboxylesterase
MKFVSRVGAAVDGWLLSTLSSRIQQRRSRDVGPPRHDRRALLDDVIHGYRELDLFALPSGAPKLLAEENGTWKWKSGYEPRWAPARDAYLQHAENAYAYSHVWMQPRPAPAIVLIHGYGGGRRFIEERAFPVRWLFERGLSVALFVLPFHGPRGNGPSVWPSVHVARTNEGFGQAIWDLRGLAALLSARGATSVGAVGMSLGGYTTALWATCDELSIAAPMIPVASFPDLFWQHGDGSPARARAEREGITQAMLAEAMAGHTPLRRTPTVPPERALVLCAEGDRIAPPSHAEKLAEHFACQIVHFSGGHLLQIGRREAFRALGRRLGELGLISR